MRNTLLVNINRLKKDSYIDVNVDDNTIRVAALAIQDIIIERVTGTCLFDILSDMVCSGAINNPCNSVYKELLDSYLFPIFSYGILSEINIPLSLKTRNAGVIRNNDDSLTQTSLDDIKYLNQLYRNKADFYINRAVNFICCNNCLCVCSCGNCCNQIGLNKDFASGLNLKRVYGYKERYRLINKGDLYYGK